MTFDSGPTLVAGRPGRRRRSDIEPAETPTSASDPRALAALRRRALNQLANLATGQQERFGRLTRLACDLFDVAFAAVAIPDGDSFWVKPSFGTWCPEYPIDHKFFRDALVSSAVTICPDTARDARWSDVLQVVGGQIRFFASVPLRDGDGADLGVFCIGDRRRREFDDSFAYLLKEIAGWVEREMTAPADGSGVAGVQDRLLPAAPPQIDGYEAAAISVPAGALGGDLYDWQQVEDEFVFMLADVEGQDATAAIIGATLRAGLRAALHGRGGNDTAHVLQMAEMVSKTAQLIEGDLRRVQKLAAVFLATISPREHRLTWVDAGHGLAVLAHSDGSFNWLGRGGLPFGMNAHRWEQHHCAFSPGDTLLLFSDGLLARDGGLCSSLADVQELLRQSRRPAELVSKISDLLAVLSPSEDVTVIAVQRTGESGQP